MEIEKIVKACINYEPAAQRYLYNYYAPTMKLLCNRYANSKDDAQDIMQEGFVKVFLSLSKFDNKGSLEGWIKRIMVNTAIDYFKKNKKWTQKASIESATEEGMLPNNLISDEDEDDAWTKYQNLELEVLMQAIQSLPEVYKIVFNMYYIENIKHKEIANLLGMDENTSRTRLLRAKKIMKNKLEELVSDSSSYKPYIYGN